MSRTTQDIARVEKKLWAALEAFEHLMDDPEFDEDFDSIYEEVTGVIEAMKTFIGKLEKRLEGGDRDEEGTY